MIKDLIDSSIAHVTMKEDLALSKAELIVACQGVTTLTSNLFNNAIIRSLDRGYFSILLDQIDC